jgi:hypothetical protein
MYLSLKRMFGEVENEDGTIETVELATIAQVAEELKMKHATQVANIYQRVSETGKSKMDYTKLDGLGSVKKVVVIKNKKYELYKKERLSFLEIKEGKEKVAEAKRKKKEAKTKPYKKAVNHSNKGLLYK